MNCYVYREVFVNFEAVLAAKLSILVSRVETPCVLEGSCHTTISEEPIVFVAK
jgi:hypothetical protein